MKRTGPESSLRPVYGSAALSIVYLLLVRLLPSPAPAVRAEMIEASRLMARASAALKECRLARGIPVDTQADPNGTAFIGVERSGITTSAGRLEAKRTTANPDFAALVVSLLREAGVRRGDAVAVGASSSFPALIVATLAAAKVLGVEALVISSLGASEWGANIPGFHWADMEECLRSAGVLDVVPIARSVGGEEDVGLDIGLGDRAILEARIRAGGVPFLEEPDLERNVARRMELYRASAGARPVKAFVNVGGGWANMGTDAEVLKLAPGLVRRVFVPPPARRGVIQAMAAAGVPVIYLLNVRGICERYGLPWDPRPLPAPGESPLYRRSPAGSWPATALNVTFILIMIGLVVASSHKSWPQP